MTTSATREKLILLLSRNIAQTISGKGKNAITKTYPAGKQYAASRETEEGRKHLYTFARRRDGAAIWKMLKRFVYC